MGQTCHSPYYSPDTEVTLRIDIASLVPADCTLVQGTRWRRQGRQAGDRDATESTLSLQSEKLGFKSWPITSRLPL